ncbi:MAG: hypothetical protein GY722_18565 [bacterium]|nr:hypothetical protein [bacterium]
MKHTNFTTIAESEWDSEDREYLKSVARQLDRILARRLTLEECQALYAILRVHEFVLCDGTVINGDDDTTLLGNRAAATIVGCFHEAEQRQGAQWWYGQLLSMPRLDRKLYHQVLGEIVAHPRVRTTR